MVTHGDTFPADDAVNGESDRGADLLAGGAARVAATLAELTFGGNSNIQV